MRSASAGGVDDVAVVACVLGHRLQAAPADHVGEHGLGHPDYEVAVLALEFRKVADRGVDQGDLGRDAGRAGRIGHRAVPPACRARAASSAADAARRAEEEGWTAVMSRGFSAATLVPAKMASQIIQVLL
jgi:hypothetical protein